MVSLLFFPAVNHKCSSVTPCLHGGVCESVDWAYQCNCTNTNHHGPMCETGKEKVNVCLFV